MRDPDSAGSISGDQACILLVAKRGGVLVGNGHTEATVDLQDS